MTDRARSNPLDRRAVLAGLLAGAGAALAPTAGPRRGERPAAAAQHREPRDRCPADPAFRAQPPGRQALRPARVPRRTGAQLAVGELRRLVGPGDGGGRQEPAGDLRRRQLDDRGRHLRRQPADRPHARAARAPARQPRPAAREASASRTPKASPCSMARCSAARCSSASSACIASAASPSATARSWRPPAISRCRPTPKPCARTRASRRLPCSRAARARARSLPSPSA